jgi:hypothetical protein
MADLMQVVAELTDEGFFGARTGQEPSICQQGIKGTKEPETLNEFAYEGIHGDQAFRFQFAEWHMDRPLMRGRGVEAIEGQVRALADAHVLKSSPSINIDAVRQAPRERCARCELCCSR